MMKPAWTVTYVDQGLLQFAGEIGLMSVGLEKNFNRYSLGGLYGVVPAEVAGGPLIETFTLRQTYQFGHWKRFDFYSGLNIFHVLGLDYQTSKFKDAPQGYYPIGSIRAILNLGLNIAITKNEERSFYFEAGMNDLWITNSIASSEEVNPTDFFSLGMGFKHRF
ncbi:MAG: hypothetical protein H0V66_10025 [Bdellovibrionales bacterium]|nr:hypothetical protein [Bdellovibrionales bacterium]